MKTHYSAFRFRYRVKPMRASRSCNTNRASDVALFLRIFTKLLQRLDESGLLVQYLARALLTAQSLQLRGYQRGLPRELFSQRSQGDLETP